MSLDLTISTKKKYKKTGTGIWVRDGGMTREITSLEEARSRFPGKDIKLNTYETDEFWTGNMTHNLGKMAGHVNTTEGLTLYDLLWEPAEHGFSIVNQEWIEGIMLGYLEVRKRKKELLKYNPPNGWGSYEVLLGFMSDLVRALTQVDLENETYKIYSSV